MVNTVMTKLKIIFIAVFLVTVLAFPCQALSTGTAYMYDANGNSYASPEAYVPSKFISGISLKTGAFSTPQDIYVDSNRNIYISDTGNNRIIVVDKNLHVTRIVNEVLIQGEKSALSNPNGIFFGNDGLLYICDTGNSRVIALDSNNNVCRNITGDDIIAVNENLQFRPEKVVADNEGIVYIVSSDIYQGILQYDTEDKFVGFFSPNEVTVSIGVRLKAMWKRIFSEEQYNYTEKILPVAYNNLFIGTQQLIYTTAIGVEQGNEIKCMNAMGTNILVTPQIQRGEVSYGDLETSYENNTLIKSNFVDVCADEDGMFAALDETRQRVFLYDSECNLICVFGSKGSTLGQFISARAIEKCGKDFLVLDSETGRITFFTPTEYIEKVIDALAYYKAGKYEESVNKWENILSYDSNYTIAYRSIGRAYLQRGDTEKAMKMLKKGNDRFYYSLALKENRKEFLRNNLLWILPVVIIVITVIIIGIKKIRLWLLSYRTNRRGR